MRICAGHNARGAGRKSRAALLSELHTFVEQDDQRVEITTSIGIYLFDGTESSYDVALHRADNAQYQAKQAGKNCYRFYDEIPAPWLGEMDAPHYVNEDTLR